MNQIIKAFNEDDAEKLASEIEKYAKQNKFKIINISAYCDGTEYYDHNAIVIFEKMEVM